MITLENDGLVFHFPEVHDKARCAIDFQRTLRIPDDDNDYPLPPGFGSFALRHLDDYAGQSPSTWNSRGGVIMPMYQAEALWLNFDGGYPCAVKVATGKICALTADPWVDHLNADPQDYLVVPEQPWLDGYCVEKGVVRQFVAMPLGDGYSAEEQVTGSAEHGGLQIMVVPMKAKYYEELDIQTLSGFCEETHFLSVPDMGLAPGGRMKQEIYEDPHGLEVWDQRNARRCFVTIANSTVWKSITGERPPTEPPSAADYAKSGLPWFDYYDADRKALEGTENLKKLKSVAQMASEKKQHPLRNNDAVDAKPVIPLGKRKAREVLSV